MESFSDKTRAVVYALILHVVCLALLVFGLMWSHAATPISIPGQVIEAELIGPVAAPKPKSAPKPKPAPPAPAPEPPKPPEPAPAPPPEPPRTDTVEREKIAEIAEQKAEKAERAQEEKRKQEQIRLEDEQKREAAERQRMKQLEDIKRQREAAEKKRKLEQEKLAQLNDMQKQQTQAKAKPTPPEVPQADQARTGMAGQDDSLFAQYQAAIQNAVTQNWLRPDSTPPGLRCMLHIVQIPGGDVLSVEIASPCNADALTRNSIEQAVKRAAPLPYKGYEKVFRREFKFNFSYDG